MPARFSEYQIDESDIEILTNFFSTLKFFIQKGQTSQFTAYDADVKLYRMKKVYERLFPWISHGGHTLLTEQFRKKRFSPHLIKPLCGFLPFILPSYTPQSFRKHLILLKTLGDFLETYTIPAFTEIIAIKSGYSNATVKNRLHLIKNIMEGKIKESYIEKYRTGEWSRTKMLSIVSHLSRVKGTPVIKKVKKHHCGDCAAADFPALCPYCGQLIIVCHHQLKREHENACENFKK